MKKYLEYKDNKRDRFWQIELDDNTFTVTFGNVGEEGEVRWSEFKNSEHALLQAEKLIEKKLASGYVEVQKSLKEDKIEIKREDKTKRKNGEIDYYEELVKFDEEYGEEAYAEEFWIVDDEDNFFEYWLALEDKEKLKEYSQSVKIFASADGTGARYAFWFTEGNTNKNKAPIIYYGSEGEIALVAENIKDLIKMLSYGCECMDGSFYHGIYEEDYEDYDNFLEYFIDYIPNFLTFREWMKESLGIKPVSIDNLKNNKEGESEEIILLQKKAQKKYKKAFDDWQHQFYSSREEEEKEYYAKQRKIYEETKEKLLKQISINATAKDYIALAENEDILEKVDFKTREEYYEKALALEPNNTQVIEKLASDNSFSNPKKAIEYYLRLIELSKEAKEYYSDLAYVYMNNKNYSEALEYYLKDIVENPQAYGEYSQEYIVDICKELKEKNPIEILEASLEHGANRGTYKILYKLYFKNKDYPKALEYALKYIEYIDEISDDCTEIGEKFFKREYYIGAEQIFRKALEIEVWDERKMYISNYIGLCNLRKEPADIDKALEAFKEAYRFDSDEEVVHRNIQLCGVKYYNINEYLKAKETLEFCLNNFDYEAEDIREILKEIENKMNKGFLSKLFKK